MYTSKDTVSIDDLPENFVQLVLKLMHTCIYCIIYTPLLGAPLIKQTDAHSFFEIVLCNRKNRCILVDYIYYRFMLILKKHLVFVLFILTCLLGQAQYNFSFTSFSYDQGLSDNYVEAIYEDSRGFIWIGTRSGLNRFDGHSFMQLTLPLSSRQTAHDVGRHYITSLVEDKSGVLWIGTLAGLYCYHIKEDRFEIFEHDPDNPETLSFNLIDELAVDLQNNIWVGTRYGLNKYNRETGSFTRFMHNPNDETSISHVYIDCIMIDSENQVWIGTLDGSLDRLNADGKTFTRYTTREPGVRMSIIRDIFEDSKQNIWVTTSNNGVFIRKKDSDSFRVIFREQALQNRPFFAALSCIREDVFGNIWISSHMGGVAVYNPETNDIMYYTEDFPANQSVGANSIEKIFRDRNNNMWLATHGGGVSMFSPVTQSVLYYRKSPYPQSLSGNIVSSFYEDSQGNMWVGTDGGGLSKFDMKYQSFTNFGYEQNMLSQAVLDITEIQKGVLAVATWGGGLHLFDITKKTFQHKQFTSFASRATVQSIYGLKLDSKRNFLWTSTFGHGMQIFDMKTREFLDTASVSAIFPYWNSSLYISKSLFDSDGTIWLIDGIRLGKVTQDGIHFYESTDRDESCKEGYFVTDIIETSDNIIYVTKFDGVRRYNRETDCLESFAPHNVDLSDAKSLLEDAHGNLWISTSQSLFRYSPKDSVIKNISLNWGMPHLQYNKQAAYRSSTGHLYFGGLNGFVVLHEDSLYTYNLQPAIQFTRLYVNNIQQLSGAQGSVIDKDFTLLYNIVLSYYQSSISIEFAVLNFIDNRKSQVAYKLDGFDKEWIYVGNTRRATYTNIPPGRYTFLVKTTSSEGEWIDKQYSLFIEILPPWWKTIWFTIVYIMCIIGLIVLFVFLRDRSIRLKNKELARMVDDKTSEIQSVNDRLREQNDEIQNQYENLREQQLLIEIKNQQLEEVLATKNKLITVIAHDFKNPLSTLLGFVKLLYDKIKKAGHEELKPNITSLLKSTEAVYSQMVEVLEWSLSKDEAVQYHPADVNLEDVADTVLSLVSDSITQKQIQLYTEYSLSSYAYVDSRMIAAVLRNLIINSIKFTNKKGIITLVLQDSADSVIIEVHDTGIGMEQKIINKILSEDIVLDGSFKAGFGLQLCKTFISRNKGRLIINSEPGKGSSFIVFLPKGNVLKHAIIKKEKHTIDTSVEYSAEDMQRCMLIVDDNVEITDYLAESFSDSFKVYVAHNGKQGLDMAFKIIPEVIISDIRMPEMDGKEMCKQLKSSHLTRHIPIVLVSAQKLPHEQVEGLEYGADDYITKPFNIDVLRQKVFALLKTREQLLQHFKEKIDSQEYMLLPDSFEDKIIKDITACIYKNITNADFKVDTLAKEVGLSRSQLYRKVSSVIGQSPNDYIKTLRLQRAVEMLKTKRYRIAEIAYEVGFSDPGYFSTCFFERYGVKPSEYIRTNS